MVLLALETLDIPAQECLVVGDTVYDIEMGRQANTDTCGVTYGNNSADELRRFEPTFLIDSFPHVITAHLVLENGIFSCGILHTEVG